MSWYQQSFTRGSGSADLGAVGEIWAFDACSGDRHEGRRRKEGCGGWGAMAVAPSRWHSARGREGKWIFANWASGRLPEDDRQTERENSGTGTTEATPVAALRLADRRSQIAQGGAPTIREPSKGQPSCQGAAAKSRGMRLREQRAREVQLLKSVPIEETSGACPLGRTCLELRLGAWPHHSTPAKANVGNRHRYCTNQRG